MKERICGFVVVRKAEYATTESFRPNLRIGQKTYRGIDRLRWEDLDLAYYDNALPASLLPVWEELKEVNHDLSGIRVVKDYENATAALSLSPQKSEIIAIWSPELEELKGAAESEVHLKYLGLDCLAKSKGEPITGEWSVLLSGVYAKPSYFERVLIV